MQVQFKLLSDTAKVPVRADSGSAGHDLFADLVNMSGTSKNSDSTTCFYLMPGQRKLIPTNVSMSMPVELEGQVRSRSGLALKEGVVVLNSPGTIDSSYRGPIGVILYNSSEQPYKINQGDRIAQLVFNRIELPEIVLVEELDESSRGEGGFGSSGR
jgi:dUTP pyrophosphatase